MIQELPSQMQVVEIGAPGGPEMLRTATRPVPQPKAGEVLIKVAAAGVNGPDLVQRKGLYPPRRALGPARSRNIRRNSSAGRSGRTLVCRRQGYRAYQRRRVCRVLRCGYAPLPAAPKGIGLRDAASLPETFFTVWSNVFMGAGLAPGETFLIHGGAGGIGTTAIQLGKAFGAKVIATDSPDLRCGICRDLGADRVIDYRQEDYVEILRQEGGANVILDIVGGPNIERNFKAATHDGRIIQLAFALDRRSKST